MQLETLILLWILFCVIHSGLIAVSTTRLLQQWMGNFYRFFRLYYNIFSLITFAALLVATYQTKSEPVFAWSGYLRLVQAFLILGAIVTLIVGAKSYNLNYVLGIEQIRNYQRETAKPDSPIVATGIHELVRHPWYSGVFILLWAGDQTERSLIVNAIMSIYLIVGTFLEERKLVLEFGTIYSDYQKQVSMLFPWKWLKTVMHFSHS